MTGGRPEIGPALAAAWRHTREWGPRPWMSQYQLVQERRDRVVLYAVAEEPPPPDRIAEIARVVRPLLGAGVEFEVLLVDRMPLEAGGLLRPSRSLVHSEYDRVRFGPAQPAADARQWGVGV